MLGPLESIVELTDERLLAELAVAKDRVDRIARGGSNEANAASARSELDQLQFEAVCRELAPAPQPTGAK